MSGAALWLLLAVCGGFALLLSDRLVSPVVRGWRTDRPMLEWLPGIEPGTIGARLFDNLLALALIAAVLLAFRLVGVA